MVTWQHIASNVSFVLSLRTSSGEEYKNTSAFNGTYNALVPGMRYTVGVSAKNPGGEGAEATHVFTTSKSIARNLDSCVYKCMVCRAVKTATVLCIGSQELYITVSVWDILHAVTHIRHLFT